MELFIQNNATLITLLIFIFFLISVIVNVITLRQALEIKKKSQEFFSGKNGVDLENIIINHTESIEKINKDIQDLFQASEKNHNLSFRGIHKFGLLRFNPFKDLGGDQSFAIALLNGKDSGLVISSLHTRTGTRIYAKSVKEGVAVKHQLTTEENEAIRIAREHNESTLSPENSEK